MVPPFSNGNIGNGEREREQWMPTVTKTHPNKVGGCNGDLEATEVASDQVYGDAVPF